MKIETDGLVIREQNIKEQDKLITVLTRNNGILRGFVHGAKSIKSAKSSASGLLTYSRFSFYKNRDTYVIDDCHTLEIFTALRNDIEKLSLAQYFCELLETLVPEGENSEEQLRLALNSLFFLCSGKRPALLVKCIFELRLMALAGYMPDLVCCEECGCFEHEHMNFIPESGTLLCGECIAVCNKKRIETGFGVTRAMRHCIYSEFDKLFSFTLAEESLPVFDHVMEEYISVHIERKFKARDFYKQLRSFSENITKYIDDTNNKGSDD